MNHQHLTLGPGARDRVKWVNSPEPIANFAVRPIPMRRWAPRWTQKPPAL